jgi:hypothetical protein
MKKRYNQEQKNCGTNSGTKGTNILEQREQYKYNQEQKVYGTNIFGTGTSLLE